MDLKSDGSFHDAISRVLLMGNFLWLPICGVFSKNTSGLKFSWKSFRAVYFIYLLAMSTFFLICFVCWLITHGTPNLSKVTSLTTFVRNVLCLICFQRLAKEWPRLMYKWSCVEEPLHELSDSRKKNFLKNCITMVHVLVVLGSIDEFSWNRKSWGKGQVHGSIPWQYWW